MIYVILWKYSDGSGFGAVRAYASAERANADVEMLKEHSETREFWVEEVYGPGL